MSIDMQFSFLSNDLASAKQSESKVRGTDGGCGDKGFGDVFDEQLQQAAEPEQGTAIAQSILLTGQEVAAMLSDSLQNTDQTSLSEENQLDGTSNQVDGSAFSTDETAALNSSPLTADESASLFQLIGKARDYAAELEAAPQQNTTTQQFTAAELAALAELNQKGDAQTHPQLLTGDQAELPIEPLLGLLQGDDKNARGQASDAATMPATEATTKQQGLNDSEQTLPQTAADKQSQVAGKLMLDDKAIGPEVESVRQLLQQQQAEKDAATEKLANIAPVADKPAALPQAQGADNSAETLTSIEHEKTTVATTKTADPVALMTVADKNATTAALSTAQPSLQSKAVNETEPVDLNQVTAASDLEQADLSGVMLTPALRTETAAGKSSSKNTASSFADFQKSANAALAQQQKQQQTESQQMPGQQHTAQSETSGLEQLVGQMGMNSQEQPQLGATLVATEKALGTGGFGQSGSHSGGQAGSQSQSSFSQILASRQLDTQPQNQPALSLLEPTAANQIKERVMFQLNQKIQSAEVRLAPEELGSVQIKINLQQEQLSVQFVVQQTAAKEALEQQMPRLKELLQEQGMALTDGQVHQQQSSEQQSPQDERRTAGSRSALMSAEDDDAETSLQQVQIAVSDRMVDYYA